MSAAADVSPATASWRDIAAAVSAHVLMLRDVGLFGDDVLAALLTALDATARAAPPVSASLDQLIGQFDERLDALAPPGAGGAAAVGRARPELVATVLRMAQRDRLAALAMEMGDTRRVLLDLAAAHAVTLMPAHADGQVAQPTTFAHFLSGTIAPLGRLGARLRTVWADVNRSPMGALALASSGLEVDRERVAGLLGCDGPVASTYDAVAATDHVALVADLAGSSAATCRRLLDELSVWLRTEPTSFRLGDAWLGYDPALPQLRATTGLRRLADDARGVEAAAAALAARARATPYGPVGAAADALHLGSRDALDGATAVLGGTRRLVGGLEVNRAYLANRAGKALSTTSDLAVFLLVEEGLEPAAARDVAALIVARAAESGVEASGITREMVDVAALAVIGREVGIEIEALNRYLAPRPFLERRTATGAPSPAATRAYLDQERLRLAGDERWREETAGRLAAARAELDRLAAEVLGSAEQTGRL